MVTKKDQKYILEAVHDEKVAEKIVEYLNVHKKEVGPEALFTSDGNSKMLFKSLFQESWNPEDFLKRLPFFYETVSLDEFDDYDDGLMYFDCTYGLSFEGILEEFDNPTRTSWSETDEDEEEGDDAEEENDYSEPKWEDLLNRFLAIYDKAVLNYGISCHELLKWLFNEHYRNFQNDWMFNVVLRFEEYLQLCEKLNRSISLSADLTVSLNLLKEEIGEETEIVSRVWGEPQREGDNLVYHFSYIPLIDGAPVLRWMGIRTNDEEKVYARPHISSEWDTAGEESGKDLVIELKLDSKIEVFDGRGWRTDYLGPNRLDVDLSVLKERRKELGFTQAHVAEAVGVELRTYQKWERNETEGIKGVKGISLVRLMHYLGFDLYDVIKDIRRDNKGENDV